MDNSATIAMWASVIAIIWIASISGVAWIVQRIERRKSSAVISGRRKAVDVDEENVGKAVQDKMDTILVQFTELRTLLTTFATKEYVHAIAAEKVAEYARIEKDKREAVDHARQEEQRRQEDLRKTPMGGTDRPDKRR